jgi:hypothetical protein
MDQGKGLAALLHCDLGAVVERKRKGIKYMQREKKRKGQVRRGEASV